MGQRESGSVMAATPLSGEPVAAIRDAIPKIVGLMPSGIAWSRPVSAPRLTWI
jgi:hypothetical protein